MVMGSIYFAMLMTNWASVGFGEPNFLTAKSNSVSMWVKNKYQIDPDLKHRQ